MGGGDLTSTSDRERSHLVIRSVAFPPDPVRKGSQNREEKSDHQKPVQSSVNHVIARVIIPTNVSITASAAVSPPRVNNSTAFHNFINWHHHHIVVTHGTRKTISRWFRFDSCANI